jgi:hypothetical protein
MSAAAMIIEDLDILFTLTVEPRPSCHMPDCSHEALWNMFWERSCPVHPANPTPYCNDHKIVVEERVPHSWRRGFKCGICAKEGNYNLIGHLLKIERINV